MSSQTTYRCDVCETILPGERKVRITYSAPTQNDTIMSDNDLCEDCRKVVYHAVETALRSIFKTKGD